MRLVCLFPFALLLSPFAVKAQITQQCTVNVSSTLTLLQNEITANTGLIQQGIVYHLVAGTGQSNMVGAGQTVVTGAAHVQPLSDPYNIVDPRIWQIPVHQFFAPQTGSTAFAIEGLTLVRSFEPLGFPDLSQVTSNAGISPLSHFCRGLLQNKPANHHCIVIPLAEGGTALLANITTSSNIFNNGRWTPGNPGADLYELAITYVNNAIARYNPISVQFYHIQGENDGDNNAYWPAWQSAFDTMITGWKSRVVFPSGNVSFVVGGMSREWVYKTKIASVSYQGIQLSQMNAPARNTFLAYSESPIGSSDPGTQGLGAEHIGAAGQRVSGFNAGLTALVNAKLNDPSLGAPSAAITFVSIPTNSITATSCQVYWNNTQPHNRITDYSIQYRVTGSGNAFTVIPHAAFYAPRTFTVTGLTASTTYDVQVAAVNEGGIGPYSSSIQATTFSLDQPTNVWVSVTTNSSITVAWTAPANPSMGSITGYRVGSRLSSVGGTFTYAITSATSPYSLTGLVAGTFYDISVATVFGSGNSTDVILLSVDTDQYGSTVPVPYTRIRSDRGVVFDANGYVTTMMDQSGNAYDLAVNPLGTGVIGNPYRGLFSSGLVNLSTIQFGVSSGMFSSHFPAPGDYTQMIMLSFDDFSGQGNMMSSYTGSCRAMWRNGALFFTSGHSTGGFTAALSSFRLNTNQMYVFTAVYTSSSSTLTLYQNGNQVATASGVGSCSDATWALNGFGTGLLNGNVSKFVSAAIWNSALSAGQVSSVTTLWANYYGISLRA